jgi:[ribosomal protein S5]-alanine N-acetyltransferase
MAFLETERLLFRAHKLEDEDDFVRMHTDPEVRRYVGGQPWTLDKARSRFREQYLSRPGRTYGLWATVLKWQGKFIGSCGLSGHEPTVRLAFYIARPYWGQGFASEASLAFIDLGFRRLHLPRIVANVDSENQVSKHLLEKFGFRHISKERIAASGRTICLYELPNPDRH